MAHGTSSTKTTGAYLDRILLFGAVAIRAGALAPRHCRLGNVDHALVVVDMDIRPLPAPAQLSRAELAHEWSSQISKFLSMARDAKESDDPQALDAFLLEVGRDLPQEIKVAVAALTQGATVLQLNPPPATRQAHIAATLALEGMMKRFANDIYYAIIGEVTGPPKTLRPRVHPIFTSPQMKAIDQVLRVQEETRHAEVGTDAELILQPLKQQWVKLLEVIHEHLTPTKLDLLHEGVAKQLQSSNGHPVLQIQAPPQVQAALQVKLCIQCSSRALREMSNMATKTKHADWISAVYRGFADHNLHNFFHTALYTPPPPAQPESITLLTVNGPRIAETAAERTEGLRQKWQKLYEVDPWQPPPPLHRPVIGNH